MTGDSKNGGGSAEVIYDFGANNGDDIPYYLLKGKRVVAVEANPILCDLIKERFGEEIKTGRLVVENRVLTTERSEHAVPFYICSSNHVLSQFPAPDEAVLRFYERVELPSASAVGIVQSYGEPYYVKIDVEHYDQVILRDLLLHGIRPPYISAESHSIDVLCALVALGGYESFKLVDGASVVSKYASASVSTPAGCVSYSFPNHSAGPFGNDIRGPWMSRDNFFHLLKYAGLGWRDIHASSLDVPAQGYVPAPQFQVAVSIDY